MDARRVADAIGIPFYVWDFSERFRDTVVQDFMDEYAAGRTPNPCMRCNEHIKFAALLGEGAEPRLRCGRHRPLRRRRGWMPTATASCTAPPTGRRTSPTCSACSPPASSRTRCSRSARRPRRRRCAPRLRPRGFLLAQKPDSHDICFIPDGDTRGWLADRLGASRRATSSTATATASARTRAPTRSRSGSARGSTSASRRPMAARASCSRCAPRRTRWWSARRRRSRSVELAGVAVHLGRRRTGGRRSTATVQIRAHADPVPATADLGSLDHRVELVIRPHAPLDGVAPGQTAVLYAGTRVLGQCTIDRTVAADRVPSDRDASRCSRRRTAPRRPPRASPCAARRRTARPAAPPWAARRR